MNGTGFNPREAQAYVSAIVASASSAAELIKTNLQEGVIDKTSTAWYAPEAKELFDSFCQGVLKAAVDIDNSFESLHSSVVSAVKAWAQSTGYGDVDLKAYENISIPVQNSVVDNNNGDIIIIENDANAVADNLATVKSNIEDGLSNLANALEAESSFLGGSQAASIKECFVNVYKQVGAVFSILTEGDKNLKNQIKLAVEKYGTIAGDVSNVFGNSSGNESALDKGYNSRQEM